MAASLSYQGRDFFLFGGKGEFDWVDVKHFALLPPDLSGENALRLLLEHVRFRDSYATATSQDEDSVELHGPYWLRRIDVSSYDRVDRGVAREAVLAFARRYSTPEEAAPRIALVETSVLPLIETADEVHQLKDLGENAIHEWGFVLDDFTELVLIDRERARLTLLVAAED